MWPQGGKLRDSLGSGFREKQSQGWRYHLQFCSYLILSCSSFPTLPPPPSVPITRSVWGRGHFLLVIRISDTHMLRWEPTYLGIKMTQKAHPIGNFLFYLFMACGNLTSPTRDGTLSPLQWKRRVLTTGPSGKSRQFPFFIFYLFIYFFFQFPFFKMQVWLFPSPASNPAIAFQHPDRIENP